MTFDPKSVEVTCVTLPKDHCNLVPRKTSKYVDTVTRVDILARVCVIDPLFFLWTHKFQLKLTTTRPLGCACIHNGVNLSHAK